MLGGAETQLPPDTVAETVGLIFLARPGRPDLPVSREMNVDPLPQLKHPLSTAA